MPTSFSWYVAISTTPHPSSSMVSMLCLGGCRQDDPLSAVDAHVGSHIFKQCIQHALATKTRLLVTHQLHLLKHADWIICMDRGEVVEQGTFGELMQMDRILATMLKDTNHPAGVHTAGTGQEGGEEEKMGRDKECDVPQGEASLHGGLMSEEERVVGGVASSVYLSYLRAAGGLMMALGIGMVLASKEMSRVGYVGCTAAQSFPRLMGGLYRADLWLAAWIKDTFNSSIRFYIGIFVGLGVVQLVLSVMNGIAQAVATSKAASTLHARAVHRVLRAPSSFFDTTPLGRIVNR